MVTTAGRRFLLQCRGTGAAASVALAVEHLRAALHKLPSSVIPVVAVPFMGRVGQRLCKAAGMSWIDLSGNAHVEGSGLRIHVEGKPNRFKRSGRPENAFAPKSARVTRWLLLHPGRSWLQRDLAKATSLTEGFTSRVVRRLEEAELLVRDKKGAVRPRDPNLLLDAWTERYDFTKHEILKGHVVARSSGQLLERLVGAFNSCRLEYAATALPSAWQRDQFAMFRIATFYVREGPSKKLLDTLEFRSESRGSNVWLVTPNDEGVFHGAEDLGGVRCVSAVQTYLDLLGHPERAKDAAEQLRKRWLQWKEENE